MSEASPSRRTFLEHVSTWTLGGGLLVSYGTLAAMAGRYLYPTSPVERRWQFVTRTADMPVGEARTYRSPTGETITVARAGSAGVADDFIALSSTCPHLGCQVHWQGPENRFFCPCHNGVFDPSGKAVSGPPAEAGQSLARFPLRVTDGLLYIEVPMDALRPGRGSV